MIGVPRSKAYVPGPGSTRHHWQVKEQVEECTRCGLVRGGRGESIQFTKPNGETWHYRTRNAGQCPGKKERV